MPFKVSDVDKYKKGLNSSQKKKWVEIANSILNDCIDNGGSDKTCAPKAIRIANSKFSLEGKYMTKEIKKVPKDVCSFSDNGGKFMFSENENGESRF